MWLEKPDIHWKPYDILAHQIVGLTIDFGEVEIDKVWDTIKRSYIYKDLSYEEFLEVIEFLDSIRLIKFNKENNKIIKTKKGLLYYIENVSVIPDEKSYDVIDLTTHKKIGILHEEFVAKHGSPGVIFILRGLPWKIEKIEKNKIFVTLSKDYESAIPSWEGELLPVPFEIAQEAQELKGKMLDKFEELKEQKRYFIPSKNLIVIEEYKDWFIIHAPFGSKVNETLARYITHALSKEKGIIIGFRTDPYRILIKAGYITKEDIKNILERKAEDLESILREAIFNTDLFLWRFKHVAKRFGVIRKDADYSKSTLRRIAEELMNTPVVEEAIREIFVEKLDINKTLEILEKIQNLEIKIIILDRETPSPLARFALQNVISDIMILNKWREIINLVKERLENTYLYLKCINCGTVYKIKVKDWSEEFKCKKCGGMYFGVSKTEEFNEKTLNITADLLKYYGKKFLLTYAGKGISHITALRILKKNPNTIEDLIKDIIEEEKRFFKIKKFI